MNAINEEPWSCHDCGVQQKLVTHNGQSFHNSNGWYWVQLHPGEQPVYLDMNCFNSYDQNWPDYTGTHETSAWRWGEWEGRGLWVLPENYFVRREAYLRLPRWEMGGSGWKLVTHDNRVLGRVERHGSSIREKAMYRALDADWKPVPGIEPERAGIVQGMLEVHLGLNRPGMVR